MEIYVKKFFSFRIFFLIFYNDFVIYINFIHIAASNTASEVGEI